jgi:MFS family permease
MGSKTLLVLVFILMLFSSYGVVGSIFVLYLKDIYKLKDVTPITLAFTISSATSILTMFIAGYLYDRYGPSITLAIATTMATIWVFIVNTMQRFPSWDKASLLWYLAGVPQGMAMASTMISVNPTLMKLFPKRRGLAISVSQAAQAFALAFFGNTVPFMARCIGFFNTLTLMGIANIMIMIISLSFFRKIGKTIASNNKVRQPIQGIQKNSSLSVNWGTLFTVYTMIFLIATSTIVIMNLLAGILEEPFIKSGEFDNEYVRISIIPMIMSIAGIAQALSAFLWGYIIDKFGYTKTLPTIYGFEAFSTALSYIFYSSPWFVASMISIRYIFFSAEPTVHWILIPALFGLENIGRISGIINSAPMVASLVSPMISGLIRDSTGSHRYILLASATLSITALAVYIYLIMLLKKRKDLNIPRS